MKAKLYRVILPVDDIDVAADFYGKLFESPGERVSPGRHYFHCGETVLACYDPAADGDDIGEGWRLHESQFLYFSVPDIDSMREAATGAGCLELTDIESMPWGERLFYGRDPFGNPICFVAEGTEFLGG